jgi:hypothetical protein
MRYWDASAIDSRKGTVPSEYTGDSPLQRDKLGRSWPRFPHTLLLLTKQTICCFESSVVARCNGRSRPA